MDFRARTDGKTIQIYHGLTTGSLVASLEKVKRFLYDYPSEFVLVRITTISQRTQFDNLMEKVITEDLFWKCHDSWHYPTVGECRGKIILLDNFSCNRACKFTTAFGIHYCMGSCIWMVQDEDWIQSIEFKLDLIQAHLKLVRMNPCAYFANFLTGAGPDITSEYLTCGPPLSLLDRMGVFFGLKHKFLGTNHFAMSYIKKNKHHVGIIFTDFISLDLIKAIINVNYE